MRFGKHAESGRKTFLSRLLEMDRKQWAVLLLLGLLLAVIAAPAPKSGGSPEVSAGSGALKPGEETERTQLEAKLEDLLSSVEGVGKVKVLLMTDAEESSRDLYSARQGTEVTGVLIAAQGAGDSVTVRNIVQAVMALFQVEAHKIKIMKMK